MSSGLSSGAFEQCAGCHKSFKRLATHIVQSSICEQVYLTRQDDIRPDGGESDAPTRRSSTRSTRWVSSNNSLPPTIGSVTCNDVPSASGDASSGKASTIQAEHILDEIEEDHDNGFPSLDDHGPWNNKESDTPVDQEGEPNKCVMKLYEELLELRSNPLGLDRFTC